MRTIQVTGHIVADAEKKVSKNGREFITFRIANNEFNDKDEQGNEKTYWINVQSFNQRHFGMAQYLKKGKPIIVVGDYSDRIYQNRDGRCEIGRDIMANAIYFMNDGNGQSNNNAPRQQQAQPTAQAAPTVQTSVESHKPTTEELKVPTVSSEPDDDELPF